LRLTNWYVDRRLSHIYSEEGIRSPIAMSPVTPSAATHEIASALSYIKKSHRPVLVIGSQVISPPSSLSPKGPPLEEVANAVNDMGLPTYLSGMARGLLGRTSYIQYRHNRGAALKKADLVILCGVPFDFRMGYGRGVPSSIPVISINRNKEELNKNRSPTLGIIGDVSDFLVRLRNEMKKKNTQMNWSEWHTLLKQKEESRDLEIDEQAKVKGNGMYLNPVHVLKELENVINNNNNIIIITDGGDFIGTASYVLRPRSKYLLLCVFVFVV
jgi:thiamine pyrophosphate-dependent acetolactate synthase large subunit-like protein